MGRSAYALLGLSGGGATTLSAGSNVFGPWTSLGTSPFAASRVRFFANYNQSGNQNSFQIGLGPSGSQVVVVPNFAVTDGNIVGVELPLFIPTGVDVWCAAYGSASNSASAVALGLESYIKQPYCTAFMQGFGNGVSITPSATAGAFGAWVSMGTTTASIEEELIMLQTLGSNNTQYQVNIGVGPSGSQAVVDTFFFGSFGTYQYGSIPSRFHIPQNTEIWAQAAAPSASMPAFVMYMIGG